jgi:hypothetical protein
MVLRESAHDINKGAQLAACLNVLNTLLAATSRSQLLAALEMCWST